MGGNPKLEQIDIRLAIDAAKMRLGLRNNEPNRPSADGTNQRRQQDEKLIRRVNYPYQIGDLPGFVDHPRINLYMVAPPRPV